MKQSSTLAWLARHLFGRVKKRHRSTLYLCFLPVFRVMTREHHKIYCMLGIPLFRRKRWENILRDTVREELGRQNIADLRREMLENRLLSLHDYLTSQQRQEHILLFDCLYDKNAEAIDAWAMFLYLREQGIPAAYVLRRDNALAATHGQEAGVHLVSDPEDFLFNHGELIAAARCILASYGLPPAFDKMLRRLPFLRYIFMEHGVTYFKRHVSDIYNSERFDKILATTKASHALFRQQRTWQDDDMILCGMPRWDLLSRKPHPSRNIFVFFTWRNIFEKEPRKARKYFDKIQAFITAPDFQKLLRNNDITVQVAVHHALLYHNIDIPDMGKQVHLVDTHHISHHIASADLLITDYSSICFDFMFLNIPVLFYRFDDDESALNAKDSQMVGHARSHDHDLYNCVYHAKDAVAVLERYILNGFVLEEEYQQKNEAFFWKKNDIRKHLCEQLTLLGLVPDILLTQPSPSITVHE